MANNLMPCLQWLNGYDGIFQAVIRIWPVTTKDQLSFVVSSA